MSSRNVDLVHRWFDEIWTNGRVDAIDELLTPDAVIHGLGEPGREAEGHSAFKNFVATFQSSFSDIRVTVDQTVEERDMVASRWTVYMTHTGADLGIPPTNRKVQVTGMSIGRFRDGQMIEGWNNWDQMGLMMQIQAPPGSVQLLPEA